MASPGGGSDAMMKLEKHVDSRITGLSTKMEEMRGFMEEMRSLLLAEKPSRSAAANGHRTPSPSCEDNGDSQEPTANMRDKSAFPVSSEKQRKEDREERMDYVRRRTDLKAKVLGSGPQVSLFADRNSRLPEGGIHALIDEFNEACTRVPIQYHEKADTFEDLLIGEALNAAKNFRRFEYQCGQNGNGYIPFPALAAAMVKRFHNPDLATTYSTQFLGPNPINQGAHESAADYCGRISKVQQMGINAKVPCLIEPLVIDFAIQHVNSSVPKSSLMSRRLDMRTLGDVERHLHNLMQDAAPRRDLDPQNRPQNPPFRPPYQRGNGAPYHAGTFQPRTGHLGYPSSASAW
jgi:hypothetical protein